MPLAKAEWEAGLSADAVLGDQCLSVGLQELFSSRQEREKNRGRVRGVVVNKDEGETCIVRCVL